MSQRTRAGLLALCLLAVLWAAAAFVPLPYVTYYPGPTVDILATADGRARAVVEAFDGDGVDLDVQAGGLRGVDAFQNLGELAPA